MLDEIEELERDEDGTVAELEILEEVVLTDVAVNVCPLDETMDDEGETIAAVEIVASLTGVHDEPSTCRFAFAEQTG